MALNATKGPIYEYACHEGNYALPGILAGARHRRRKRRSPRRARFGVTVPHRSIFPLIVIARLVRATHGH